MNIHDDTGTGLREGVDIVLNHLMQRYNISRRNAAKLLGEALCRSCIIEEIDSMCDWQLEGEVI